MWWGISAEVGSKLPFSHAYFPYKHHLLKALAGPLSCEGFLHLNHCISKSISQAEKKIEMVDHKSMWSIVMNFPDWFYFASLLLLSAKSFRDSFHFKCAIGTAETDQSHDEGPSCSAAAARYIAWILNPISESHQDLLADCLNKISGSLTFKQFGPDKHNKATNSYKKKLKKPKLADKEDDTSLKEYDCQTILFWLKDFQDIYITHYNRTINSSASSSTSHAIGMQQNVLFRRISLGILIGSTNYINEEGCDLLLHYAATGKISESMETQNSALKHRRWNSESQDDSISWTKNCNRKEAVAGACLIFHLTDVAVSMADSVFENEESGVDFICRVKLRAGKYLLKCVEKLLQLKIDQDDDVLMLRDLYNRLVRWRYQGKDVSQGCRDLDDAIHALSSKLSSL